jgi:hypothetical protein
LELRIFDEFPEKHLSDVLRLIVWMCDEALFRKNVEDPRKNTNWNDLLGRAVLEGKGAVLSEEEKKLFSYQLNVSFTSNKINEMYDAIWDTWCDRWNYSKNTCTELMVRRPLERAQKSTMYNNTVCISSVVSVGTQTDADAETRKVQLVETVPSTPRVKSKWCCW